MLKLIPEFCLWRDEVSFTDEDLAVTEFRDMVQQVGPWLIWVQDVLHAQYPSNDVRTEFSFGVWPSKEYRMGYRRSVDPIPGDSFTNSPFGCFHRIHVSLDVKKSNTLVARVQFSQLPIVDVTVDEIHSEFDPYTRHLQMRGAQLALTSPRRNSIEDIYNELLRGGYFQKDNKKLRDHLLIRYPEYEYKGVLIQENTPQERHGFIGNLMDAALQLIYQRLDGYNSRELISDLLDCGENVRVVDDKSKHSSYIYVPVDRRTVAREQFERLVEQCAR